MAAVRRQAEKDLESRCRRQAALDSRKARTLPARSTVEEERARYEEGRRGV